MVQFIKMKTEDKILIGANPAAPPLALDKLDFCCQGQMVETGTVLKDKS
jgi:hypothetical protein